MKNDSRFPRRPRLGIIGGGRAAWTFGRSWQSIGWGVAAISLREGSKSPLPRLLDVPQTDRETLTARSDVVFVAVPDSAIEETAASIRPLLRPSCFVFHASGSLTSAIFGDFDSSFSLHPFRALPPVGSAVSLKDALLVFEGSRNASSLVSEFAQRLGAVLLELPGEAKTLYHAGAVFASNFVAVLLDIARDLEREVGVTGETARHAIAGLARSAIDNWDQHESIRRFTGPVARGDTTTVERHVTALGSSADRREIYRRLSLEIVRRIAAERALDEDGRRLEEWLESAVSVP
ncbi:MAG TPA: Rossmann-like and DUF2520 domain-containing protein [Thermoanaerobaculia bacterium]|nr:Rossmann-like and DUF2520 domain-containing protein [Thermoanaerobaculia bacterium]